MGKKRRNKKYQTDIPTQPVIHRYVAEDEDRKDGAKRLKRKLILWTLLLLPVLLLLIILV